MENNLWWKTTFGGRQPLVKDSPQLKTSFGGRWPSVEDTLPLNTTFDGRRALVEGCLHTILYYIHLHWKPSLSEINSNITFKKYLEMTLQIGVKIRLWYKDQSLLLIDIIPFHFADKTIILFTGLAQYLWELENDCFTRPYSLLHSCLS